MTTPVDETALRVLFTEGRSTNDFADRSVPDDVLREVHDLARWAPTSFNRQPLRLHVVRTPEARERLLPLVSAGNREEVAGAPVTVVCAADAGAYAGRPDPREEALVSASLQVAWFVLAARARGLAAGPMSGVDAPGLTAEWFGGDRRAFMIVNLGWPRPRSDQGERAPRLTWSQVAALS